jgi:hypothetical protein
MIVHGFLLDVHQSLTCYMENAVRRCVKEAWAFEESANPYSFVSSGLQGAIRDLETCMSLAGRLGIFSRNEELDDISTANLKYLLIHAYLASLLARTPCIEPRPRAALLEQAVDHYNRYTKLPFLWG